MDTTAEELSGWVNVMNEARIKEILQELKASKKKTIVCLATTANKNNPDLYVGSLRETDTSTTANFIFRSSKNLSSIIKLFDGVADLFLVDCELKNELLTLEEDALREITSSAVHVFKPNDITVESLDSWVSALCPKLSGKKVGIVGAGNIGCKTAIKLAERGASVFLWSRSYSLTQSLTQSLRHIIRGQGTIKAVKDIGAACHKSNIILGCTPGVPVISSSETALLAPEAIIFDVGNGTITPNGIVQAHLHGAKLYCLTPEAGFIGYLARQNEVDLALPKLGRKAINSKLTIISAGLIGQFGDVIVKNIESPDRAMGVCDGKGDILSPEQAEQYLANFNLIFRTYDQK